MTPLTLGAHMNKQQVWAVRGIGVFTILLAAGLAIGSWHVGQKKLAISTGGTEVVAEVWGERVVKSGVRTSHYVTLRYPASEARTVTREFQVPDDVFDAAVANRQLRLKYNALQPEEIDFIDFPYNVVERYIAASILAVIGTAVAFFAFRWQLPS